uniref:Major capsid protein n=1 Tax=Marseillevirus LCMAC101 TaxID=2506602 RepID=A0A481YTG8_9VIRU|nr:MAG: major capsid protein [Marseillevirus LCMAC101]
MSFSSCNPAHTFIDLATFSEQEGFIYGGPDAITLFVASVQKANWFSYIPITLRQNGVIDFGQKNVSASVNRSGDYVLHVWFRAQIPQVEIFDSSLAAGGAAVIFSSASVRWTRNLMHNLFERISISFNELIVEEFDNYWLDFNFQFRKRGSKRIGYRNMIGDIASMTTVAGPNVPLGTGGYFSVPFPFWFTEDSGIALPVAALPFNDVKINYVFRRWEDLLVIFPGLAGTGGTRVATCADIFVVGQQGQKPTLLDPQTNAHYAVVHNDERVKMGDAPRDILITQIQATQAAPFKDISTLTSFDLRLSHSIILFCFSAQNVSLLSLASAACGGEWSNYTTEPNYAGLDPIAFSTLVYENTCRVAQGSDYYSLILPDLLSEAIPDETGYHFWTYALLPWDPLKPSGSTNYSKLANVSISHNMSPAAQASCGIGTVGGLPQDQNGDEITWPDAQGQPQPFKQVYRHILIAKNWNIARVAEFNGYNRRLPSSNTVINSIRKMGKQCYRLVSSVFKKTQEARYLVAGNSVYI